MTTDALGRRIHYLRISITDRCNFRCSYCMPRTGVKWLEPGKILTYEEIIRFVEAAVLLGIDKVRVTGGEPLVREGVVSLISELARIPGIRDLAMTTNGSLLSKFASDLKKAGLKRLNISLDTLSAAKFAKLCYQNQFEQVIEGIRIADSVGLQPIKINIVVMKGFNEDEIAKFARLTLEKPYQIRFIECMPFKFARDQSLVSTDEMKQILADEGFSELCPQPSGDGPAQIYSLPGAQGTIGFISPMTRHFCSSCNRIRLTADGMLKPCLLANSEYDIRSLLRSGASKQELADYLRNVIFEKPAFYLETQDKFTRGMSKIGG